MSGAAGAVGGAIMAAGAGRARRLWSRQRALVVMLAALAVASCAPRLQPPGEGNGPAALFGGHFRTADGELLPVRRWLPKGPPRAVILALHGFNDYSNAFAAPATYWASLGIATYAYDQRGFGNAPHRRLWPGVAALTTDFDDFARALRQLYPDLPLYVLGDSMGGAVALAGLAGPGAPAVTGLILAAPAVWARRTMNPLQSAALWLAAHTVPWLEVTGQGLHIRPSDNIEMLRALVADPLVIKGSRIDTLYGLVNLMDAAMAGADKLTVPTLVLYGDHDEIVPRKPMLEMLARARAGASAPLKAAFYRDGFHMLLRDLHAELVWQDIAAWIAAPDAPLPSGADRRAEAALAQE